jgi:hypothetical protein
MGFFGAWLGRKPESIDVAEKWESANSAHVQRDITYKNDFLNVRKQANAQEKAQTPHPERTAWYFKRFTITSTFASHLKTACPHTVKGNTIKNFDAAQYIIEILQPDEEAARHIIEENKEQYPGIEAIGYAAACDLYSMQSVSVVMQYHPDKETCDIILPSFYTDENNNRFYVQFSGLHPGEGQYILGNDCETIEAGVHNILYGQPFEEFSRTPKMALELYPFVRNKADALNQIYELKEPRCYNRRKERIEKKWDESIHGPWQPK